MTYGEPHPLATIVALTEAVSAHRNRRSCWSADFAVEHPAIPASELFKPDNPILTAALDTYAHEHGTDRRIAASQIWKNYTYWLAVPVVAGWVARRHVLDVSAETTTVFFTSERPYIRFGMASPTIALLSEDSAAKGPGTISVGDEKELLKFLIRQLIDEHLAPASVAFRERSGLGNRILWGSVAVALTHPFSTLSTLLDEDLTKELEQVRELVGPTGRLVDMALVRDAAGNQEERPLRRTCCQKMRIPGETNCISCPLLSPARRAELSARKGVTWLHLETRAPATL